MNQHLVSVVIPSYNYGHFVTAAVDSVLAQTYPHIECIVVDDGSTDDTGDRLAPYGNRIRYIRQANQGLSAARNTGIQAASGEYVALLDADDAFHPQKVELQVAHLVAEPELGLLGTSSFTEPERMWPEVPRPARVRSVSLAELVIKSPFAPSSVLFRKDFADAVGGFDTDLRSVEDRDYWIRVATRYPVAVMSADLLFYRLQPGSMSRNPEKMERFERMVLEKAFAMPDLAGRFVLRRRAFGLAEFTSAYTYYTAGRGWEAADRLLRSFCWWPMPYRAPFVRMPFARLRLLIRLLREATFGGRPDSGGESRATEPTTTRVISAGANPP